MTNWAASGAIVLGTLLMAALPATAQAAHVHPAHAAHVTHVGAHSGHGGARHHGGMASLGSARTGHLSRYAYARGRHGYIHLASFRGISCVPFARQESGIALTGNAATWWDEAEGRYARGSSPEAGSVLNFRANASMHLGHVAVVTGVVNTRQIEIDQANWWGPGGGHGVVSRDISVVDVSPHNDWTAVRVALGHSGQFGSVYPTYGFIYQRAEGTDGAPRVIMASAEGGAVLNPAPRDLRRRGERTRLADVHPVDPAEEVAEAPDNAGPLVLDAPDHSLR